MALFGDDNCISLKNFAQPEKGVINSYQRLLKFIKFKKGNY